MNLRIFALAAASAFALAAAAPALADPSHGHPPGLAKKPHGMPPGQAKKMWSKGERLPVVYITERRYFIEPARYHLAAPPPGYRWVIVDGDAYLAQTRTGLVLDVVRALLN